MSIMPLYNLVVLPGAKLWLQSDVYQQLTGKAPVSGEKVTILYTLQDKARAALTAGDFQPIGVAGVVSEILAEGFVCVDIMNRVNIEEIALLRDRSFSMTLSRRPDINDLDPEDAARRLTEVKDRILSLRGANSGSPCCATPQPGGTTSGPWRRPCPRGSASPPRNAGRCFRRTAFPNASTAWSGC